MARILVINPNSSTVCSAGVDDAVAPFRFTGGPAVDVETLAEGPPAIYSWRDWHSVVDPLCRMVEREPADAYVIACASDPGIEAVRSATAQPVFGVFRAAVAAAVARAETFGVIAMVDSSKQRHIAALRAMGLDRRLAAEVALNVDMATLLNADVARDRLIDAARSIAQAGGQTIVLGCTGMARHRPYIEQAVGIPVIEPCQAAVTLAIGVVQAGSATASAARM